MLTLLKYAVVGLQFRTFFASPQLLSKDNSAALLNINLDYDKIGERTLVINLSLPSTVFVTALFSAQNRVSTDWRKMHGSGGTQSCLDKAAKVMKGSGLEGEETGE